MCYNVGVASMTLWPRLHTQEQMEERQGNLQFIDQWNREELHTIKGIDKNIWHLLGGNEII